MNPSRTTCSASGGWRACSPCAWLAKGQVVMRCGDLTCCPVTSLLLGCRIEAALAGGLPVMVERQQQQQAQPQQSAAGKQ